MQNVVTAQQTTPNIVIGSEILLVKLTGNTQKRSESITVGNITTTQRLVGET